STVPEDRAVVSHVEIKYPSRWNFNNLPNFYFELPSTATGNYLEIENFNTGGSAPVLLDIISQRRYIGDITSTPGKIKFVLPASSLERKFQLVSSATSNVKQVTALQQRSFVNYAASAS